MRTEILSNVIRIMWNHFQLELKFLKEKMKSLSIFKNQVTTFIFKMRSFLTKNNGHKVSGKQLCLVVMHNISSNFQSKTNVLHNMLFFFTNVPPNK